MITIEEYVKKGGCCPRCNSGAVTADDHSDTDFPQLTVLQHCRNCKKYWYEVYEITGIEDYKHE